MEQKLRWLSENFGTIQLTLVAVIGAAIVWLRPKTPPSNFKVREADRPRSQQGKKLRPGEDPLANAKLEFKRPLQLSGIRIDGRPHEVLGIRQNAGENEIREAYKNLMMQYHPDRIGPQGSQQWQDAQSIAAALNEAKRAMLEALSTRSK